MVIGGVAAAAWGEARGTEDVDVTIWVDEASEPQKVQELAARLKPLDADPLEKARRARVLRMMTSHGVRADIAFGTIPFERHAIRRARRVPIGGREVVVCSPEVLIIHKLVADRPRDRGDVEAIIKRQWKDLNRRYLDREVRQLAKALARPEIWSFYQACLKLAKEAHG